MAQSVEQLIRNQQAAGSSPASSSKENDLYFVQVIFFNKKEKGETMNPTLYLIWCLLPLFLLLWWQKKRSRMIAALKRHRAKKFNNQGETAMLNVVNAFIGKKCEIDTIDKSYVGTIETVEENWIVVNDAYQGVREIVNLEYVTSIRECKIKKKKSKEPVEEAAATETAEVTE